jgi:hypothetical protein
MLKLLKSLLSVPQPAGPPRTLKKFASSEGTITQDGIRAEDGGWRIDVAAKRSVKLFEVTEPGVEQCMVGYAAELRTANLKGKAHLEMWCRFPGQGEFFSKDLAHAVSGTEGWSRYQAPFYLKKGQRPDLLKLNVAVEGTGTVWIRNVEVTSTPLA